MKQNQQTDNGNKCCCCGEVCGDDREEVIERAKNRLLENTNISSSKEEMDCIHSWLTRCWQMGWLDGLKEPKVYNFKFYNKVDSVDIEAWTHDSALTKFKTMYPDAKIVSVDELDRKLMKTKVNSNQKAYDIAKLAIEIEEMMNLEFPQYATKVEPDPEDSAIYRVRVDEPLTAEEAMMLKQRMWKVIHSYDLIKQANNIICDFVPSVNYYGEEYGINK